MLLYAGTASCKVPQWSYYKPAMLVPYRPSALFSTGKTRRGLQDVMRESQALGKARLRCGHPAWYRNVQSDDPVVPGARCRYKCRYESMVVPVEMVV